MIAANGIRKPPPSDFEAMKTAAEQAVFTFFMLNFDLHNKNMICALY
jgi:hypothetical protein